MPPAAKSAPLEFAAALVVCLIVIGTSFLVEPPMTKYVVMVTGGVMFVSVVIAALAPGRKKV